ncbi:hypothetical protein [Nostoc sp.]|uniref:hypothetical protein n=1 Tax=Nostoc sp. TaxID=1180 RepID=UPI002FF9267E
MRNLKPNYNAVLAKLVEVNYSDLPKAEVDRSQFIGNSHQLLRSFFGLTFPPRAGVLVPKTQIFLLRHVPLRVRHFLQVGEPQGRSASPISLVFACGIDGQDITYLTRKSWGFVIHPEFVFTIRLKSIPDAILKAWLTIPTCACTLRVGTSALR